MSKRNNQKFNSLSNHRLAVVELTPAEVKVLATSVYKELVPCPGPGKALVFHGAVLNIHGGTTDYDQDGDLSINYTDNSGVAASEVFDDFLNDGTTGSIGVLRPANFGTTAEDSLLMLTENAALVLVSTAAPYNAAGNRALRVEVEYSVVDVLKEGA